MKQMIEKTMDALRKNNFEVEYFETAHEAAEALLKEISVDATIGIGGSVTIKTMELDRLLMERGNRVSWHWLESTPDAMDAARQNAAQADVYLTSTNALTQDGKLVNTDGMGNRVAAMFYGPAKTIVVCGINKIVEDLDAALARIESNAYKNARRMKLNTPCAINEHCLDCSSPQRMCNITTIIRKKPMRKEFKVVLINEELGY